MIVSSPNPRSASQPAFGLSCFVFFHRPPSRIRARYFPVELPSKWVLKICTQFLESLGSSFHFTGSPWGAGPNTPTKCANFKGCHKKNQIQ
ncbi:hypothetical protein BDL97_08G123400 [Sphagnum fallax]|nr:hypothetical protein BDL97_08G123400 [Sphagnum fallax]